MLVATTHESHEALQLAWRQLKPHPVLGKWLYISLTDPEFERVATAIVENVRRGGPLSQAEAQET